ncbi:hypothetical protein [Bacillus sp. J37]|nr:hypothetical protein [Bacillus sp. J37]
MSYRSSLTAVAIVFQHTVLPFYEWLFVRYVNQKKPLQPYVETFHIY